MSNLDALPEFARTNELKLANIRQDSSDESWEDRVEDANPSEANLITSVAWRGGPEDEDTLHYPLLDLDMDAALLPSSTPGHHHLYIKKALSWERYQYVLAALFEADIIQEGVYENAKIRGWTSLRMPHVKKGSEQDHPFKSEKETQIAELQKVIQEASQQLHEILYPSAPTFAKGGIIVDDGPEW